MADRVEDAIVACSTAQRAAVVGEPICALCGRYGAYVCDATDEDVCSLECRDAAQARAATRGLRAELGLTVAPDVATPLATSFDDVALAPELVANMTRAELLQPTPIQMQVLPLGLAGHDVLLSAPTGTGKTVAFLLPLLARAMAARFEINGVLGLILAPVRELCIQIEAQIKVLVQGIPKMRTALLVGGMPLPNQLHRLAQGPQVLIGTPGRLLAIHTDHGLMLQDVRTCVLDEADRLCDDEFRDATTTLLSLLPVHRQLFFASATMTPVAEAIARTLAPDVLRVAHTFSSGPSADIPRHVTQHVQYVANAHKTKRLFELLRRKPSDDPLHATLVFVASQQGADVLVKSIYKACNVPALSIHGGKSQAARLQAMEAFVAGTASILVATYVLGRGMDLLSVDDVVIFDLPPTVDEYVHLVGRAGRSGDPGRATVFVNEENARLFPALTSSVWATVRDLPTQVTDAIVSERKRKREPIEALCQRAHDAADHWRDWTSTKRKRDDGDLAFGQPRQRIND